MVLTWTLDNADFLVAGSILPNARHWNVLRSGIGKDVLGSWNSSDQTSVGAINYP